MNRNLLWVLAFTITQIFEIDDGEYCLLAQNKLVSIYCHNMDTTPKEYITLRYSCMHKFNHSK